MSSPTVPTPPPANADDDRVAATHWVGEHRNTLHGNGAGSKDMELVSGDEDEVNCQLCHYLLEHLERDA